MDESYISNVDTQGVHKSCLRSGQFDDTEETARRQAHWNVH